MTLKISRYGSAKKEGSGGTLRLLSLLTNDNNILPNQCILRTYSLV